MFGTHDLTLFIISGLLLNIAPGPDSLLIVSRSVAQGWRAGCAAALGIGTGTFVHVFAAALGLSAVLATSATAFTIVKWLGAAYLLYIGLSLLLSRPNRRRQADSAVQAHGTAMPLPYRRIYLQGLTTNVLNPKVAVFFLAFVPQFISPDSTHKTLAFLALGFIFNFNGMLWCLLLAISSAFASSRIRIGGPAARWLDRVVGALFVSLGVRLALADRG